jgi:lipopolysaccharide export system permease protein
MVQLPILERYIGYEILKIFLVILVVLSLILVGGTLVKVLKLAASGAIPTDSVMTLMFLQLLRLSGRLIPATFFLAAVMALGRMYQDQEMTVLQSSGFGPGKIRRIVLVTAVPLAIVSAWLTLWVYPVSGRIAEDLKNQHQEAVLLAAMGSGRFYEARGGKLVFYAESAETGTGQLGNVFIQVRKKEGVSLVTARTGKHFLNPDTGLRHVVLFDGHEYNGKPGSNDYSAMHFDEYEIVINAPEQQGSRVSLSSMPTLDLLGENSLKASIELQSRLLLPLSVIAFGLLAIPLSRSSPRKSSYLNLVLAVVFYMTFMALLKSADQWMLLGLTPAWMGLWWILVVMFLIAPVIEGYDQMRFRLARRRRAAA